MEEFENGTSLILGKLADWYNSAIQMLPNLVVAIAVICLFWVIARSTAKFLHSILSSRASAKFNPSLRQFVVSFFRLAIFSLGMILALTVLNLDKAVISLLAGVGVLGLALGFAFKDLASNLVSGLFLSSSDTFGLGQVVNLGNHTGTIEEITLRNTAIRTSDGLLLVVPNQQFFQNSVLIYSGLQKRRIEIRVGATYDAAPESVRKILLSAIATETRVLPDPAPQVFSDEFGDSSINYLIRVWMNPQKDDYSLCKHAILDKIYSALKEQGIEIPFPTRTFISSKTSGRGLESESSMSN